MTCCTLSLGTPEAVAAELQHQYHSLELLRLKLSSDGDDVRKAAMQSEHSPMRVSSPMPTRRGVPGD